MRKVTTALWAVVGAAIATIASLNVEELAIQQRWNKGLVDSWPSIMSIIDSAYTWAAFGFLTGATLTMWVFRFIPERKQNDLEATANKPNEPNQVVFEEVKNKIPVQTLSPDDIELKRQVIDEIWQCINDRWRSAYYLGHQLRNSWDTKIIDQGQGEFVGQIKHFLSATNEGVQSLDKILRRYEYLEDINLRFRSDFKFHNDIVSSGAKFVEAIQALPENPTIEMVRLSSPQAKKFNDSINEFGACIERTLQWAKEEISVTR